MKWLMVIILSWYGLLPVHAAAFPRMTLTVHLQTTERPPRPVPNASLTVLDGATRRVVVLGSTDVTGHEAFQLAAGDVRVVVGGQHPNGIPLRLIGQDVDGIWVRLPAHDWQMELRADTDGAVFPDLARASAGAPDGADARRLAQGLLLASGPTATPLSTRPVVAPVPPSRSAPAVTPLVDRLQPTPPWAYLLLVVLGAALLGVVWASNHHSSGGQDV